MWPNQETMEDTIGSELTHPYKSLPMRVTYKEQDYTVHLLQKEIDKTTREVRLLLDGIVQTIVCDGFRWRFDGDDGNADFAQAIWNSISLRYRL